MPHRRPPTMRNASPSRSGLATRARPRTATPTVRVHEPELLRPPPRSRAPTRAALASMRMLPRSRSLTHRFHLRRSTSTTTARTVHRKLDHPNENELQHACTLACSVECLPQSIGAASIGRDDPRTHALPNARPNVCPNRSARARSRQRARRPRACVRGRRPAGRERTSTTRACSRNVPSGVSRSSGATNGGLSCSSRSRAAGRRPSPRLAPPPGGASEAGADPHRSHDRVGDGADLELGGGGFDADDVVLVGDREAVGDALG